MSGVKAFFDTNVLLYMYGSERSKRERANRLFEHCARETRIFLSTQVIQEFYAAGSRKLHIQQRELQDITRNFLELPLVIIQADQIRAAMENEQQYNISFWDALILAAAQSGGAEVLSTEYLNDGQRYGSVVARNPFRPDFAMN